MGYLPGMHHTASRRTAGVMLLLLLATGCGGSDDGGEPVRPYVDIPRTNVALQRPDGFEVDDRLPGFKRPGTLSSFVVTQVPRKKGDPDRIVDQLEASFRDEALAARQGLKVTKTEQVEVAGYPALSVTGTQRDRGQEFGRALVAFPAGDELVTLRVMLESDDPLSAQDALEILRRARRR